MLLKSGKVKDFLLKLTEVHTSCASCFLHGYNTCKCSM